MAKTISVGCGVKASLMLFLKRLYSVAFCLKCHFILRLCRNYKMDNSKATHGQNSDFCLDSLSGK